MTSNRATYDTEVLFKLLVVDSTCALDASRASSLTHKHAHMTAPTELESASGMNISRHWSRHAFRDIPKAQYTFKSLLVHGILQFTMLITLRCALHRCSSRDIRRWKLCLMQWGSQDHPEQYTDTCAFQQITVASQQRKTVQCCSTTRELVHQVKAEAPRWHRNS